MSQLMWLTWEVLCSELDSRSHKVRGRERESLKSFILIYRLNSEQWIRLGLTLVIECQSAY